MDNSSDEPCPTASCVEGSGKHGPHTSTGRTTLQIILSALNLYPYRGALPNPMDDEEIRLSKCRRVELASQHLEGLPTLCVGTHHWWTCAGRTSLVDLRLYHRAGHPSQY